MSGPELADELRLRHPDAKVLFMSGYTEDGALRRSVRDGHIALLAKPFTSDELGERLRRLLDAPNSRT